MIRRPPRSPLFPSTTLFRSISPPAGRRSTYRWKYHSVFSRLLRSEEHTSELQSLRHLVCRLLLEKISRIDGVAVELEVWGAGEAIVGSLVRAPPCTRPVTPQPQLPPHGHRKTKSIFFNDPATTEIYTLSLPDALPISVANSGGIGGPAQRSANRLRRLRRGNGARSEEHTSELQSLRHLVFRLLLE